MSDDENDHGDGISFGDGVTMHMDTKLQAQMDEKNKKVQAKRDQMTKDMEDRLFKPDRLEHAKSYANSLFKEHKMKEAGAAYERLLPLCVDDEKLTISILSNLAAVRIREWKWKESLDTIDKVLDIDPNHAKAMYRQAQAFRGMRELELALKSIARSRTATDPDNKPALTDLDSLESAVTKEIDRRDREAKERKESQERKARRMKELANKQSRKVAAQKDGSGLALPPAECGTPTGDVGQQTNWAQWFYKQLSTVMCDEENRYMIHEEDGWMEVIEAPETKCEIVANVKTNANGERFLHYELNCVLYCMVTQFRAPADAPGALGFHVNVYLKNIDNLTPPDEWICYVDYCKPGDYKPATRIKKMMEEYARPQADATLLPYDPPSALSPSRACRAMTDTCARRTCRTSRSSHKASSTRSSTRSQGAPPTRRQSKQTNRSRHRTRPN